MAKLILWDDVPEEKRKTRGYRTEGDYRGRQCVYATRSAGGMFYRCAAAASKGRRACSYHQLVIASAEGDRPSVDLRAGSRLKVDDERVEQWRPRIEHVAANDSAFTEAILAILDASDVQGDRLRISVGDMRDAVEMLRESLRETLPNNEED